MTIPKIAKHFHCNKSALYQKFNRHKAEFEGHYEVIDGVISIHTDVINMLLPEKVAKTNYAEFYKEASERNKNLSKQVEALMHDNESLANKNLVLTAERDKENCRTILEREKIKLLIEDRDYYEKMLDELNAKIAELQNQLSEKSRSGILSVFTKR